MSDGKERQKELTDLIQSSRRLTKEEYIDLLYEIRDKNAIELAILANQRVQRGSGSILNILEKVHYLIDSAGGADKKENEMNIQISFMDSEQTETTVCS